jgi:nucleoside-diphosphate-sugar epimerase
MENLESVLKKIEVLRGDILDEAIVARAVSGVDYVLHQAALRSVPKSVKNPLLYNDNNVTGTLMLLNASSKARVKRFVFASSSSVYGESKTFPQKENVAPMPVSPYAATKLAGEHYCRIFTQLFGLETVSLRYFNVFGPRQSLESEYAVVVPKFISCMLKGENPPVHGDGTQARDFTYVENVVSANIKAATSAKAAGKVFNVASGKKYSILQLIQNLNEILSTRIAPRFVEPRPGDVRYTHADIRAMKQILGCRVSVDFKAGLKKTAEYFKRKGF